jgi:hypothetical protein
MDGDMVIVKKPKWYENWKAGKDLLRVSQSKDASMEHFGEYQHLIDKNNPTVRKYRYIISSSRCLEELTKAAVA